MNSDTEAASNDATERFGAVTSPLIPVRHAFLTRRGGVSMGIYASLNVGRGSDDESAAVERNRAIAAAAVGVRAPRRSSRRTKSTRRGPSRCAGRARRDRRTRW